MPKSPDQPTVATPQVATPQVATPQVATPQVNAAAAAVPSTPIVGVQPMAPVSQSSQVEKPPSPFDAEGKPIPAPAPGEQCFLILHHGVGPFSLNQIVPQSAFPKGSNFDWMIGQGAIQALPNAG